MPLMYPTQATAIKTGLFPDTIFVRRAFAIDNGQHIPKQISIIASNKLINIVLRKLCINKVPA
jgi:hypothetical protein